MVTLQYMPLQHMVQLQVKNMLLQYMATLQYMPLPPLQLAACSWFCTPLFLPPLSSFFANISFHFHWTIYPFNLRMARLLWRRQSAQIA